MHRRTPALVLSLVAGFVGCQRGGASAPPHRHATPPPTSDTARMLRTMLGLADAAAPSNDGAVAESRVPLTGPLAACVQRVARMPREIASAAAALEYPSIGEDACRLDLAVSGREPALCNGIVLSALRQTCQLRSAIVRGAPDECPIGRLDAGHDPFCLALATRDVGLCAACVGPDVVRCVAVANGDLARCDTLDPLLRPNCTRDVDALVPYLPRLRGTAKTAGTATLTLVDLPTRDDGPEHAFELDTAARGAYLDPAGVLVLIDPIRGWPSAMPGGLPPERARVGLSLRVPRRPGPTTLVAMRIVLPDGRVLEPITVTHATAEMTRIPRARSDEAVGSVSVDAVTNGSPVRVRVSFATFVRDVTSAAELGAMTP